MDDPDALLSSLGEKREGLNQQAHRQREVRDKMNDQTRAHAQRRDGFNAQVRGLVEKANAHRSKRDELNAKVREAKARRDELNREAHAKQEALQALRKDRGPADSGVPVARLRAEVRHLEYQQQTTVLTPKKEKELIDLIGAKLKELKAREGALEDDAATRGAWEEMKAAKARAEEQHAAVTVLANAAQAEHDAMVKLFAEADTLRKDADAAQADFVKSKVEADKIHRDYIESITALRDIDKVSAALRGKPHEGEGEREREGRREPQGVTAQDRADAEDIFDKFRKGEKLSTEDLMALQKAGRL